MKRILAAAAIALLLPSALFAKSDKRGVSENKFQYWAQMEALEPGVTWFYNWGSVLGSYFDGQDMLEYVPMCWNASFSADKIREYCSKNPQIKYLLGFNEPNFRAQADMTPAQAAAKWPELQALAKELNLGLVAPALNYSPDAPYYQPTAWMDEFVNLVGPDAFDYTCIHAYGGFGVMSDLATTFHERYGKPVWVTEFCYWPGEMGNQSPASQILFMMEALEWLEKTEWIYRYAWFKATEPSDANYNLLEQGRREEPRELTEQGKVYCHMSTFDPEVFHPVNTVIPAKEYITQSLAILGSSADSQSESPIEISQFNAGASLDYQFDVPSSGDYNLVLRVSGVGEPTRWDPNLGVVAVNSDGSEGNTLSPNKQFSLSGDNAIYENVVFPLTLSAGKQTIRLKDFGTYQPSGIRISTITLAEAAGVDEISVLDENKPVNVYNLQGVCVLKNVAPKDAASLLPCGIYLIGSKKIAIK